MVAAEWVQFGMGSFFETPPMSPYVSAGGPSSEYLPLWKNMKKAKLFGKTTENPRFDAAETLRLVVTDSYFRQVHKEGTYSSLRRRRPRRGHWPTSWRPITSSMAPRRTWMACKVYFKEVSKMPRDIELDEDALLYCFCKSFGLLDDNGKVDTKGAKFQIFAGTWETFLEQEEPELRTVVTSIHEKTKKLVDASPDGDKIEYTERRCPTASIRRRRPRPPDRATVRATQCLVPVRAPSRCPVLAGVGQASHRRCRRREAGRTVPADSETAGS